MDIFSTGILTRAVNALRKPDPFLLRTFFPTVVNFQTEHVFFDRDNSKMTLAPFVAPTMPGRVRVREGEQAQSLKPAYIKPKDVINPGQPLRRRAGEAIGGALSPSQRLEGLVSDTLSRHRDEIDARLEWMAAQALLTSTITVAGDNYPSVTVDYGRNSGHTIALAGATRWGEAGVSPWDDLQTWINLVQDNSGAAVTHVIMGTGAWNYFAADAKTEKQLDRRYSAQPAVETGLVGLGQTGEVSKTSIFRGRIGADGVEVHTYRQPYTNDAGSLTYMIGANQVILVSAPSLMGERMFGAIQDGAAGYAAVSYFSKSWEEQDPAVRYLLTQSAPLIVPKRPNASLAATVR